MDYTSKPTHSTATHPAAAPVLIPTLRAIAKDDPSAFNLAVAGVQGFTIHVTFVATTATGNTKVVMQGGQPVTWYEYTGTWTFDPLTITIPTGQTGDIKLKLDRQGSTNGWKLVSFNPKSTNPPGGPAAANADGNGDIDVPDANGTAGTYYYGVYMENQGQRQYASYDPSIIQEGGGGNR